MLTSQYNSVSTGYDDAAVLYFQISFNWKWSFNGMLCGHQRVLLQNQMLCSPPPPNVRPICLTAIPEGKPPSPICTAWDHSPSHPLCLTISLPGAFILSYCFFLFYIKPLPLILLVSQSLNFNGKNMNEKSFSGGRQIFSSKVIEFSPECSIISLETKCGPNSVHSKVGVNRIGSFPPAVRDLRGRNR